MKSNKSCALKTSQRINTPARKRNTRVSTKAIRKPHPRRNFDLVDEKFCIRKDSIENNIISMLPNIPSSCQPYQVTHTPSSFKLNESPNATK
jgi:hypothetical protein